MVSIVRQGGFFNLPNDNMAKTIGMATLICLVCSIVVSTSATVLKPKQVLNQELDKKRNILSVAGIADNSKSVEELFKQIEPRVVDLQTGEYTDAVDAETYDQLKASKDPDYRVELSADEDIAGIGGRAKYANVYLLKDGEKLEKIIIPIKGYGLWSTLYGFLALEGDARTVGGITFYDHKETPGLGGEIENKKWQASWQGKQVVNQQGQAVLGLIKGNVSPESPDAKYQIDGLAGATLTSVGVTNMIQFWAGENGFGPYLERIRGAASATEGGAASKPFSNNPLSGKRG
ncbi:MAG: Na(+)-translocating NADH-quinone reductase subunit C [Gammaproteobacteria bacterium]|nr:Na(+)-translocating NADH-quinone reductase subunit C [Gammaproteobacteria bacterium]